MSGTSYEQRAGGHESHDVPRSRTRHRLVREHAAPVEALSREIFDSVSAYTRGVAQYDDQTVLVARAV